MGPGSQRTALVLERQSHGGCRSGKPLAHAIDEGLKTIFDFGRCLIGLFDECKGLGAQIAELGFEGLGGVEANFVALFKCQGCEADDGVAGVGENGADFGEING